MLEVIALFIGKSVQVIQLQRLLASRFAQMALVREARERTEMEGGAVAADTAYQNPEEVARILARSFYKEMTRAGFAPGQVVSAATEPIGQLGGAIQQSGRAA